MTFQIWSKNFNYLTLHDKNLKHYKISAQLVKKTTYDKMRTHNYIIKESKKRYMYPKVDIYCYTKIPAIAPCIAKYNRTANGMLYADTETFINSLFQLNTKVRRYNLLTNNNIF